jgi:molybdate transport system ATP-binding protein
MTTTGITVVLDQAGPIPLGIAFSCEPSSLTAIVGPSGAGKTTVLRSIAGLYTPASARITCGGAVWHDSAAHIVLSPQERKVGLVFQSYALFPHLDALRNVEAALSGRPAGDRRQRARELLALVHLSAAERRRPLELSGGEQQRVALARALAREPDVLLLDEPLSAVDRRTRRHLHNQLLEVRAQTRCPIILVTHDIDEAAALADQMIVIDRGEVIQHGAPRDVLASPASSRVREALDI